MEVEVKITNTGAGHKIPIGVIEEREIWLELIALDAERKSIIQGLLTMKGKLTLRQRTK